MENEENNEVQRSFWMDVADTFVLHKMCRDFFFKAWEIHNFTASAISLQGVVYERQKKVTVTRRVLTKKKFLVNNLYCHNFIFCTKKFDYRLILGS